MYDVNEQQIYTRPSFSADTSPSSDTGPSFSADTSLSSSNKPGCSADIFQYPVGAGDPSGAVGTKAREYTPEGTGGAGKGSQQRPWAEYFVPPSKRKRKQVLECSMNTTEVQPLEHFCSYKIQCIYSFFNVRTRLSRLSLGIL